jgi:membrane-bound lytic murein transglycosylase D
VAQFPLYPVIAPNVRFWEKVYGTYSSNQGILHDKNHLGIIYTAVDLVAWGTPGAAKINSRLIKFARARYKNILTTLSSGRKPSTKEEKRIAALFKENGSPSFRQARDNIRLQIGQKDRFQAGVVRSGAYIPGIKRILRAHDLPVQLAYLPHVESSFNLKAHSKSAAVGLWQFTKHTGRDYMTINDLVDERYDAYLSSHAAAKFLKEN